MQHERIDCEWPSLTHLFVTWKPNNRADCLALIWLRHQRNLQRKHSFHYKQKQNLLRIFVQAEQKNFEWIEFLFCRAHRLKGGRSTLVVSNYARQLATHGSDLFVLLRFGQFVKLSFRFDSRNNWVGKWINCGAKTIQTNKIIRIVCALSLINRCV